MSYVIRTLTALQDVAADGATRVVADVSPGYSCRRCLTDAKTGDELLLFGADPFDVDSPYRGPSPIYLHADGCGDVDGATTLPPNVQHRLQSVRAYDDAAFLRSTALAQGDEVATAITDLLSDPAVAYLHVHNAGPGCFNFRVDRMSRA